MKPITARSLYQNALPIILSCLSLVSLIGASTPHARAVEEGEEEVSAEALPEEVETPPAEESAKPSPKKSKKSSTEKSKKPSPKKSTKPSTTKSGKPTAEKSPKPTSSKSPKPSPKPSPTKSPSPSPRPLTLWTAHARKLIGEPEAVTRRSIAELRRDPALSEKLQKALGTKDHFLALDVIATLKLKAMTPVVLNFAGRDKTGFCYHALNQLIEPKDFEKIGKVYRERLAKPNTSLAAKMAMLDTLGRIGTDLDPELLGSLLADGEPEVRSAALYYLRNALLYQRKQEFYPLLRSTLRDSTFQIRLQTLYLVSEIPVSERTERSEFFTSFFPLCENDPHAQVKALCTELAHPPKGKHQ